MSFLPGAPSGISPTLPLEMMIWKERGDEAPLPTLPPSACQDENSGIARSEINSGVSFVVSLYCVCDNRKCEQVPAIKYELHDFSNSAYVCVSNGHHLL